MEKDKYFVRQKREKNERNNNNYYDFDNMLQKYNKIIEHVMDLIQNNKAKFALRTVFGGPNLMILSV